MLKVKEKAAAFAVAMVMLVAAPMAMAQTTGTDYSSLVAAVDWSDVVTNIITVFAAGVTLILAWMGGRFIIRAIKGSH